MPQFSRLERTVLDSSGNALSGVNVTIYREGATVNGNQSGVSPLTVTVRHNGKILAADSVFINTATGTTYTVDSTTSTTVVLSGFAGTLSLTNGDRLVPSNSTPTLYADDRGGATKANPLSSSSTGLASGYIAPGVYDVLYSGGSATATLYESELFASAPEINTVYDVRTYGAKGDGTTDDTTAIQNAINESNTAKGGIVFFPRGNYRVTSLTVKQYVTLQGIGKGNNPDEGSTITGLNTTQNILQLQTAPTDSITILDLNIQSGKNSIAKLAGSAAIAGVTIKGCNLTPSTGNAGIYIEGGIEELTVRNCRTNGGGYGVYFARVADTNSDNALDRSTFEDCFFTGHGINAVRLDALGGNGIIFSNCTSKSIQQSAVRISGNGFEHISFIGWTDETSCLDVSNAAKTTGSITSGTNSLTVASSAGYVVGDTATVRGAGPDGTDLSSVITAIAGNVLTLTNNADTTVTSLQVTRSTRDAFQFGEGANNGGADHVFMGCDIAGSPLARYSINWSNQAGALTVIATQILAAAPIYDPRGDVCVVGGRRTHLRSPASATITGGSSGDLFRQSSFPSSPATEEQAPRVKVISPHGKDIFFGLSDSNADGTGTYGVVQLSRRTATSAAFALSFNASGVIEGLETTDPAAPGLDRGRLYFRDNGAGKTQLVVVFNTGAVQVIATQP